MEDRAKRLFKIYDNSYNLVSDESIHAEPDQLTNVAASIYSPGPSFQAIFDFPTRAFDHVSKNVEDILGYSSEDFTINKLMSIIHPDDVPTVLKNETLAGIFLNKYIQPQERPYYKATYQYRAACVTGDYILLLHQAIILTHDHAGNISKTFLNFSDISKYKIERNKKVSFIDIRGIKSYTNIEIQEDLKNYITEDLLSSREMEVLQLISEGYNSKEIANMLHISYDTVRTHRNNIIAKKNFKSINQAIAFYIRRGVL
jgi:DNA-binding CsgD family transcriptional regulator